MNQPTLEELLKEPLELLKKEAEEHNKFFQLVSEMRNCQIERNETIENTYPEIDDIGFLKKSVSTAEKQVDDFLAKLRTKNE